MSLLFYFYLAAVCTAVLLATVAIWAPRRTVPRAAAVALAVAVIPASYAALTEILGKPKPVAHEWWSDRSTSAVPPWDQRRRRAGDLPLGPSRRGYAAPLLPASVAANGGGTNPGGDRRGYPHPWPNRDQGPLLEPGLGQPRVHQHRNRSPERAPAEAPPAARPDVRPAGGRHLSDPRPVRRSGGDILSGTSGRDQGGRRR